MEGVFDILSRLPTLKALRFFQVDIDSDNPHSLPAAFALCKNLDEIDFSQWQNLLELPEEIGGFSNLHSLELADVDYFLGQSALLRALPESLCNLPKLEKLDVYGCDRLTKLPNGFQKFAQLVWLDTMSSGINELAFSDEQAGRLTTLRMNRQEVDYKKFTSLNTLSIYNNEQAPLDLSDLAGLQSLTTLEVFDGTLLSTEFLTRLPNLRELRLTCRFDKLPEGLKQTIHIRTN